MPYREKSNLLALAAMLVAYVPYFVVAAMAPVQTVVTPNLLLLTLFAAVSVVRLLILGVGYLWFRIRTPEDVREPADERDRAITRRSTTVAYYVLMAGTLVAAAIMPVWFAGWTIVNAALFAIVLAEIVRCLVAAVSYRRGWNG
ncbi:hypothetical protein MCEMIH16_02358 [Caulobacteraceae bacterium]|jgi:hypothetical protein